MTEHDAWDIYFAGLMSIRMHPGNDNHQNVRRTMEQCVEITNMMIQYRRTQWHGSEAPSQESSAISDKTKLTTQTPK